MLDLAAAGRAIAQGLGGDVHDDLLAIGAGRFEHVVREEAFGNAGEGVGTARAETHDLFRRSSGNVLTHGNVLDGDIQRLHHQGAGLGGKVAREDEGAIIVVSKRDPAVLPLTLFA
jgi:hypothetical protein